MTRDTGRHRRRIGRLPPLLALAAAGVTLAMWLVGWLPPMERAAGDLLVRSSTSDGSRPVPVAVVVIDDLAVEELGPLPWPRDRLARLLTTLTAAGGRGFVIDLILSGVTAPEADLALADALAGVPHVLAAAFDRDGYWLMPLNAFGGVGDAAHAYGEVGPDGVVRTIAATKQAHAVALPALSLAAARLLRPELAIEAGRELRPLFRPSPQTLRTIGASTILRGSFDPGDIDGRIVFIGISATGAGDQFVVPTGPRHEPVPGVLAHASAAASIMTGRLVRLPSRGWSLLAALIVAVGIQLLRDRRGAFDLAAFAAVAIGLTAIAMFALRFNLILIPIVSVLTAAVVSALLRETVESRAARRESGLLLQAVLAHVGAAPAPVPRTAAGRLDALRRLQERVLEEDATRRALLTGMEEGVVLWSRDSSVMLINPAAEMLWGGRPEFDEVIACPPSADGDRHLNRGSRALSIRITDLGGGQLAIIRDMTAERALEQRRREMQRLVSHELKTPLASIAGFGESLERYELTGEERRRVASLIRGEAQRLRDMVTVFLDLERLGGGHWDGALVPVDLGRLVEARLEILEVAAQSAGLEIVPAIDTGTRVRAAPALLEHVVDNLIGNAITYASDGGTIEVEVVSRNGRVDLVVRDHGPGIAAEHHARVFERFYRVPGSSTSGAGLGLALVAEVVDWHEGCITIDSETGAGSTFTVSLPAIEEA